MHARSLRFPHFSLPLVFAVVAGSAVCAAAPIPEENRIGGFVLGTQGGCFKNFSVFESIEKSAQAGARFYEFSFRLKKFSPDRPNVLFNIDLPDAEIQVLKAKLKQHGLIPVNYGSIAIPPDEAGARKIFDFAKKLGLPALVTEAEGSIDMIEKLVREYDIKVGFHNHAQRDNEPNYKMWDPHHVLALVRNRDRRIGACADVGHWQTAGIKAIDGLRILEGRIVSVHLKDRPAIGPGQHDVVFGTGISDIGGLLAELRRQKFDGNISIEYEYNWDDSVADIAQCIGFVRGWAAANR